MACVENNTKNTAQILLYISQCYIKKHSTGCENHQKQLIPAITTKNITGI